MIEFFSRNVNPVLRFIWKCKRPGIDKTILKRKKNKYQQLKVIVIKAVCYQPNDSLETLDKEVRLTNSCLSTSVIKNSMLQRSEGKMIFSIPVLGPHYA